jgi:hypothetical protein
MFIAIFIKLLKVIEREQVQNFWPSRHDLEIS